MGACFSSAPKQLIEDTDGGEDAYHKRYMEGEVLGEGEFGQVRLVHDTTQDKDQNTPYASKVLKKGMVFKDNTLYSPIKVRRMVLDSNRLSKQLILCRRSVGRFRSLRFFAAKSRF